MRHLGGEAEPLFGLKLHRPAAAYTSHPLWAQLTGPHCSLKEAFSLLAGGLAADFVEQQGKGSRELRALQQQLLLQRQQAGQGPRKRQRHMQEHFCVECGAGSPGKAGSARWRRGLCERCYHRERQAALREQTAAAAAGEHPAGGVQLPAAWPCPGRATAWSGLEPVDCRRYCLRLPPSVAGGKCGNTSMPGEARAAATFRVQAQPACLPPPCAR